MIIKLLAFTFAMIIIPIGSYFLSVHNLFSGNHPFIYEPTPTMTDMQLTHTLGNSTYAGALAAIMANMVLIGYIFVAMAEDQSDQQEQQKQGGGAASRDGKKDR